MRWNAGVEQCTEAHVAGDSGEAVEIGNAHGVSRGGFVSGGLMRRGNGCDGQHVVHGAAAVALGIQRDVSEAERTERGGDAVEHVEGEGTREVGASDLDTGEL